MSSWSTIKASKFKLWERDSRFSFAQKDEPEDPAELQFLDKKICGYCEIENLSTELWQD